VVCGGAGRGFGVWKGGMAVWRDGLVRRGDWEWGWRKEDKVEASSTLWHDALLTCC
jgi:hypothetical protein